MGTALVDRNEELRILRREADASEARLVLVHGQRRVGKTFLVRHAWENRRVLYHLAVDSTSAQNRLELLQELDRWTDEDLDPEFYPNWRSVFTLLGRIAGENPLVVVLDEFQYLLADRGSPSAVPSHLNAAWETDLSDRNLTLILCGSEVGTMRSLGERGALYGRMSRELHLTPFDYRQAALMLGDRPPRELAYLYGIFGGTPGYLASVDPSDTLRSASEEKILTTGSPVHLQLETLIDQEEGIDRTGLYRAVLRAVAGGQTQVNEIAQAAGFERSSKASSTEAARRVLTTLRELGYVRRERNFDAGRTTAWRHYLADNALSFFYRFVHANRSLLELGAVEKVWNEQVRPQLDAYMGWDVFEEMTREAYRRYYDAWNLPAPAEWSRWEGQDRNRRHIEIDLVCRGADDRLLTGEVKWSSSPIGPGVHRNLQRDLDDLGSSGYGWARAALDPERSAGHLYVSAAGFTGEFERLAENDGSVHLVSLADLYA